MKLLAIDPGNEQSAYAVIDENLKPIHFGKLPNEELLCHGHLFMADTVFIEQIGHYGKGMPAGRDVFDTCVWIGRFQQAILDNDRVMNAAFPDYTPVPIELVLRVKVKVHLCGSSKANDGNVSQALRDRFAPGVRNYGRGLKDDPGFFHGFAADVWQAYALAVYAFDTNYPNGYGA